MMVLANLLEHPEIGKEPIHGTNILRSNKDLGRVLAIASLVADERLEEWNPIWERGLRECFPGRWQELAGRAGKGLRALLDSPADLQQAVETCANGILAGRNATSERLKAMGSRLLVFAIEPLENKGKKQ